LNRLFWRMIGIGRFVVASVPLLIVCYATITYAQETERTERLMERRLSSVEISVARHEERWVAVVARIDAIDKTLWWLIVATFGGTSVSGVVAADRAMYKWKQNRGT